MVTSVEIEGGGERCLNRFKILLQSLTLTLQVYWGREMLGPLGAGGPEGSGAGRHLRSDFFSDRALGLVPGGFWGLAWGSSGAYPVGDSPENAEPSAEQRTCLWS